MYFCYYVIMLFICYYVKNLKQKQLNFIKIGFSNDNT